MDFFRYFSTSSSSPPLLPASSSAEAEAEAFLDGDMEEEDELEALESYSNRMHSTNRCTNKNNDDVMTPTTTTTTVAVPTTKPATSQPPVIISQQQQQQQQQQAQEVRPESIDAFLAEELNQMSFQEREGIHEEIHGVHTLAVDETSSPDFVREKLSLLQDAIDNAVPAQSKTAYLEAVKLNSRYVHDADNFRLPLLRAELFDPTKAAIRLCKYLDWMYELYGTAALMRPVCLSDMNPTDMKLLKEGCSQVLPGRDRSGRRMICLFDDIPPEYPLLTRVSPL